MSNTVYHSILRIAALTFAVVLLFDSGLLSPVTQQLSQGTQNYLAQSIGMYASVQPTEINQLTAELTKRERELAQRESAMKEREIAVDVRQQSSVGSSYSTYILSVILFIILVLLVINYTLDFTRARRIVSDNRSYEKMA